jgi:hypothetical protein
VKWLESQPAKQLSDWKTTKGTSPQGDAGGIIPNYEDEGFEGSQIEGFVSTMLGAEITNPLENNKTCIYRGRYGDKSSRR